MRQSVQWALAALGIMILAVLTFYQPIWTLDEADRASFEGDVFLKDYPTRVAWVRQVRQGDFPFWNPYEFGGWPALANCEAGVLYPLNWLLVAAASDGVFSFYQFELLILLHFVLAGWFFYLLARQYGLRFTPAILAALIYAFCGFHGGHKLHVNLFFTVTWFPLILFFIERGLRRESVFDLLWGGVFMAVAFLAGHPQMSYYIGLLAALRLMWQFPHDRVQERGWAGAIESFLRRAAVLFLPAFGLAAAQIIPSLELFALSNRSVVKGFEFASEYSLPPQELVEFALPNTFGWYYVEVFYVGIWTWFLAWAALTKRSEDLPGAKSGSRIELFWLAVFGGGLLLALGKYSGLLSVFYTWLPGIGKMRAPSRFLYLVNIALALLAGFGLDRLVCGEERSLSLAGRLQKLARGALVIAALALIYLYAESMKPYPQVHLDNLKGMADGIFTMGVYLGLGWLVLRLYREKRVVATVVGVCFCILAYVDVATFNSRINVVDGELTYEMSDAGKFLREEREKGSLLRYLQPEFHRVGANGNMFELCEAGGFSPIPPAKYYEALMDSYENPNLLRMMGIDSFVREVPPAYRKDAKQVIPGLWRIEGAFPRAFAVEDIVVVRQPEVRKSLLMSQAWDYARLAWVNRLPGEVKFKPVSIEGWKQRISKPILLYSAPVKDEESSAYIVVDGFQVGQMEEGFNLAVFNSYSGEVEKSAAFHSLNVPYNSQRFVKFIRDIPEGKIVLGAASETGPLKLSPEAVKALQSLGLQVEGSGKKRTAHAFIGLKGGKAGSAVEVTSEKEAILVAGARGGRVVTMTSEMKKAKPRAVTVMKWVPGYCKVASGKVGSDFLVVTENDYPGWSARQEGKDLELVEANTLFMALAPEPDAGEIRIKFRPTGWPLAAGISIASLIVVIVGLWRSRPSRSRHYRNWNSQPSIKSYIVERGE